MQVFISVFAFIFYRVSFKPVYEENISIFADLTICLLVFVATTFVSLQAREILISKIDETDPYISEKSKVGNQSFTDILFFTLFILIPFNVISILGIFGFSDNLWEYGIINDGYIMITGSLLSVPVIIYSIFTYIRTKEKFQRFRVKS